MAFFTWLDFSEQDRQRALDVLDLFREKGTVDELGIGTVRDALADVLFPGTSTIMSRARYYLFIPWIYQELERKRISSSEIAQRGKKAELALIEALYASGERAGLIGVEARKTLKRLPSTIYWQGLGILGVRRFPGSRERYHRALDRLYRDGGEVVRGDDGHAVVGGRRTNWDPQLPLPPADFPATASFALTAAEATYFRERVMNASPHSYFAYLVSNIEQYRDKDLPWDAPLNSGLPPKTASELQHAQNFSDCMHGAALTYNLMLAEQGSDEEPREKYRVLLDQWAERVSIRMPVLESWSRSAFWAVIDGSGRQVTPRTRAFINTWLDRLLSGKPRALADDKQIRVGIRLRERQLKGSLARLENARALERWGGASSAEPLDFRWSRPTRTLLRDLKNAVDAA